jgi:hypothetical protein
MRLRLLRITLREGANSLQPPVKTGLEMADRSMDVEGKLTRVMS